MVQILPVRELDTLAALNQEAGFNARFAFRLHEAGMVTGWILYDIDFSAGEGIIRGVSASDDGSFDGLTRAAFSILSDSGIEHARFDRAEDIPAAERLGFVKNGSGAIPSLSDILRGCRHCCR